VLMIRDFGRPDQQHLIGDMLDRGAFDRPSA
jgi:acyl-CoA dehydrogenase